MTNNLEQDSELRKTIQALTRHRVTPNVWGTLSDDVVEALVALINKESSLAFEHGRAVGKYQAADSLYGHTTTMYVFKDGDLNDPKIEYPERIKELLKDCEALMNNNAREYSKYIKRLKEQL